jgi:hypothetical protein
VTSVEASHSRTNRSEEGVFMILPPLNISTADHPGQGKKGAFFQHLKRRIKR